MIRLMFCLACISLVILVGCGGGGGGGGGGGPSLQEIAQTCSLHNQTVSCTNPGSQSVATLTPNVAVTFTEAVDPASAEQNVQVLVENLSDGTNIRDTVARLVIGQFVEIRWSNDNRQVEVRVLKVASQLVNGKSYRVLAEVAGGCVQTATRQVCQGSLGPFTFLVKVS